MSPSSMFDGDVSFTSEASLPAADEVLPSIELDHEHETDGEPQPYKSSYTSRKSISHPRRSSGVTNYSLVSGIPSETSITSRPIPPADDMSEGKYSPRKDRPRFRNPESIRAMQMSSPPPLPAYEASRERLKGSYKLMTPSRSGRSETPVSKKSGSRRNSLREQHSPRPTPTPQQAPLVLLHVTILPPQVPFSPDLMVRIMPEWLVENYKVLEEKLQDIILMRRGLLIPHPRDEYDLLEERILESLELKTPRLLKCGHFVPPELDSDEEEDDDRSQYADDCTGRGSRMSGGTLTQDQDHNPDDEDVACMDCHRHMKKPGKGVGAGRRKWDIKIYAANGLMREAAWAACWNDMERCDVEISPWIPDEVRKTFERRVQEEQEAEQRKQQYAMELQRQIQSAASKQAILEEEAATLKKKEDAELQKSFEAAAAALERSKEEKALERAKFANNLEEKIEEAKESIRLEIEAQALKETTILTERLRVLEAALLHSTPIEVPVISLPKRRTSARSMSAQSFASSSDIPLGVLVKNYVLVLLRDQRNFVIVLLSIVVVYLSINMDPASRTQLFPPQMIGLPEQSGLDPVSTVAVTTTATATSTMSVKVFETMTVTQVVTASNVLETMGAVVEEVEDEGFTTLAQEDVSSARQEVLVEDHVDSNIEVEQSKEPATIEQDYTIHEAKQDALIEPSTLGQDDSLSSFIPTLGTGFSVLEHIFDTSPPVCPK